MVNGVEKRSWFSGGAFRAAVSFAATIVTTGCAVLNEDNRYVSSAVASLWPESTVGKVAVSPVIGPAWIVGIVVDAVAINPVMSIPRSFFTAVAFNGMIPHVPVVEILVFPVRIIAFPIVFIGAEITYSMVPL